MEKIKAHADTNTDKVLEALRHVEKTFSEKIDVSVASSAKNFVEMSEQELELSIQHQVDMLNKKRKQAAEEKEAVR